MSEIKVNKLTPRTNCGTVTLGDSGDTFTIPAGVTITNNGTQTGFGREGSVNWQTTPKTVSFTAVNGEGYFINSAGGQVTVTLPASPSSGDIVSISDYNSTAATNSVIIARNGSNINGGTNNLEITENNSAVTLVYVDGTTGWQSVSTASINDIQSSFIAATGGTVTCSGDFKIHTFTGPGTFTVTRSAGVAANNVVSYLVVAGGASGGASEGGGGGAGGFREYKGPVDCYSASPLDGNPAGTAVTVLSQSYPITVGAGGASRPSSPSLNGASGSNSIFSTITSAGGGGGGSNAPSPCAGVSGGSGGGSRRDAASPNAAAGNTPPVTPPQGNNGGSTPTSDWKGSGGGGGATAVGANGDGSSPGSPGSEVGGPGGAGATTSITGSPTAYSGGGGGSINGTSGNIGTGGTGGGGNGSSPSSSSTAGTANTGGGGGGVTGRASGAGGSGIVVIRYKFQ